MARPNFVFVLTDTQATNVIGVYGHPELHTSNIDRLAQTGVKFERAYTTCPVCTPARAAMFTGMVFALQASVYLARFGALAR